MSDIIPNDQEESIETNDLNTENLETHNMEEDEGEKFRDGQALRMVRVRFPGNSRSFAFIVGERKIDYGQKVLAMSDRGMAVGYINSFAYDFTYRDGMPAFKTISRLATEDDIKLDQENYIRQKQVETICHNLIEKYQLEMNLTHVEFTQFGKKAVFYFIAPARVDFRELVKELVSDIKMRVELRQISVRDRSASIGGIGSCGRELCCSSFLTKYGNVGVKMAKNQDLSLNFTKLNGVCGQLKCCLQYEDEVYTEKRKKLPKEGDIISCHNGDKGRVIRLHLLSEQFELLTFQGIKRRYVAEQFKFTINPNEMPEQFDGISDETKNIIGIDQLSKEVELHKKETETIIQASAKDFAQKTFENLFGTITLDASLPEIKEENSSIKVIPPEEEEELINAHVPMDEMEDELEENVPPPSTRPRQEQSRPRPRQNNHRRPR